MHEEATSLPVEQRIGHTVKRAEQAVIGTKDRELRQFGLTVPQYAVLLTLGGSSGLSAAELARRCFVTPQTMATILSNLDAKELIERTPSPDHAKVLIARLTRSGRRLLRLADERATAIERHLADAYTDQERATLLELLERGIKQVSTLNPEKP